MVGGGLLLFGLRDDHTKSGFMPIGGEEGQGFLLLV